MKPRHPAEDPQPGDVLAYKGWTANVTGRDGDTVLYQREHPEKPPEDPRNQDIAAWRTWAVLAKVVARAPENDECLVISYCIAGPCTACGALLGDDVHVMEGAGVRHGECCKARKHNRKKVKAKEKAA